MLPLPGDGFHDLALRVVQPIGAILAGVGGEKRYTVWSLCENESNPRAFRGYGPIVLYRCGAIKVSTWVNGR